MHLCSLPPPLLVLLLGGASAAPAPMNTEFPYQLGGGRPAPPHRGSFIEVFSRPIRTTYSEVFWAQQAPIPLPEDFVRAFADKTVAFTGYEVDVVRKDPERQGQWRSVPCYEQYNHHFAVGIQGNASKMAYVGRQTYLNERDVNAHRHAPMWEARERPEASSDSNVPVFQMMVEGNGNEHRRTFKYIPTGFGQLIASPVAFAPNFMFINTNNPDTNNWGARGGPLPSGGKMPGWTSTGSMAPPNASYSGLLECPCTTRVKKSFTGYTPKVSGACGTHAGVATAQSCFDNSAMVYGGGGSAFCAQAGDCHSEFQIVKNATISDASEPAGCYVLATPHGYEVYFNTMENSTVLCGETKGRSPRATGRETVREAGNNVSVALDLNAKTGIATITLTGPAEKWFAVGFGATKMADAPYAIVVEPPPSSFAASKATLTERKLADHAAGNPLPSPSMLTAVSDTVINATRTVVMTRALVGKSSQYYTFDPSGAAINVIMASGTSPSFGYHGATRGGDALMMVLMGAPVCLCKSSQLGGSINGLPWTSDCFNPILQEQHNPSCDITTYRGGMTCCHDGVHLLDADQELPTKVDEFYAKFRFYYEPDPVPDVDAWHETGVTRNAFFLFREVEFNHGEYDIVPAAPDTPPEERVDTLISNFQVKDTIQDCKGNRASWMCAPSRGGKFPQSQEIDLVHVSAHCHAPSCISMELINADTGRTICLVEPVMGTGDAIMDEAGYVVALPPCIFGPEKGLQAPPRLSLDTNLTAIKKSNSTYFHYGVMAHWQMRGAWAD
jgi:hypothetical protein